MGNKFNLQEIEGIAVTGDVKQGDGSPDRSLYTKGQKVTGIVAHWAEFKHCTTVFMTGELDRCSNYKNAGKVTLKCERKGLCQRK